MRSNYAKIRSKIRMLALLKMYLEWVDRVIIKYYIKNIDSEIWGANVVSNVLLACISIYFVLFGKVVTLTYVWAINFLPQFRELVLQNIDSDDWILHQCQNSCRCLINMVKVSNHFFELIPNIWGCNFPIKLTIIFYIYN